MTSIGRVAAAAALCLAAEATARAEPATGFLVQGQLAGNLVVNPGIGYGIPSLSLMPIVRLGAQLRRMSITGEVYYSSFATIVDKNGIGLHVIAIGPNFQPALWRSADENARLSLVVGFNVGAAIPTSDRSSSSSSSDNYVTGGFVIGVGGHYFMHRNFALGVETGIRAQFLNIGGRGPSVTYALATVYAALSLMFVAGS